MRRDQCASYLPLVLYVFLERIGNCRLDHVPGKDHYSRLSTAFGGRHFLKVSFGLLIALVLMAGVVPAAASHRPKSYCSESGDVCASTKKVDGVRKLRISLAAKYFSEYTLCVRGPNDDRTCKKFFIERRDNGTFGDSVRWRGTFPNEGPGAYTVRWKTESGFRSELLGFHAS